MKSKTIITAHSGSDGYQDNSKEFIEAMLLENVDAIEVDVIYSDSYYYLSHDELEKEEIVERLSLDDFMKLIATNGNKKTLINVDCKHVKVGPLALALAESLELSDRVYLSGAVELDDIQEEKRDKVLYNLSDEFVLGTDYQKTFRELRALKKQGIKWVQSNYLHVRDEFIEVVHDSGLKLSVWTVNNLNNIKRLEDLGVDNITTRLALAYRQA